MSVCLCIWGRSSVVRVRRRAVVIDVIKENKPGELICMKLLASIRLLFAHSCLGQPVDEKEITLFKRSISMLSSWLGL